MPLQLQTRRLLFVALLLLGGNIPASDHADPIRLENLEAGLTGLFAFPSDDNLVLILNLRRALGNPQRIEDIGDYLYRIHLDWNTPLSFADEGQLARFGGRIPQPEGIAADATLSLRLNPDLSFAEVAIEGLASDAGIERYAGVRDDPFIFPRFFGTNVVAMVLRIPFSAFPAGAQDFVIWGSSEQDGKQIDHVGRSNRTMQPRFDFLNTLHPSEHLAAINQRHNAPGLVRDIARTMLEPLFALRAYDFAPDVMIYSRRYPAGFPNGRLLSDDVAALTCDYGDCLLWELSWAQSRGATRATANDLPFLDDFPYLAQPHPMPMPAASPSLRTANKVKLALIGLLVLGFIVLPWGLWLRQLLKTRRLKQA